MSDFTARELCDAISRQGHPDRPIKFIDLDGNEMPFRWMYGEQDNWDGVTIRLDVVVQQEGQ